MANELKSLGIIMCSCKLFVRACHISVCSMNSSCHLSLCAPVAAILQEAVNVHYSVCLRSWGTVADKATDFKRRWCSTKPNQTDELMHMTNSEWVISVWLVLHPPDRTPSCGSIEQVSHWSIHHVRTSMSSMVAPEWVHSKWFRDPRLLTT